MDSLIATFHLDVKLMIAQLVNFAIVAAVLWWFALKPLLKVMNERSDKIDKSLRQAKEIEARVVSSEADREAVIKKTKASAVAILTQAQNDAEAQKQAMMKKAKEEVEKIVVKGREQLAAEKEKIVSDAKSAIADLVVDATEKVLGSALTKEVNKKVVEEAIKEIK